MTSPARTPPFNGDALRRVRPDQKWMLDSTGKEAAVTRPSPPYPSLARQVRAFFRLYAHALALADCHLIRLCRWVSIQDQGSRMHANAR